MHNPDCAVVPRRQIGRRIEPERWECTRGCSAAKWTPEETCTCGSGGHPRPCEVHPDLYKLHCAEISLESLTDELEHCRQSHDSVMRECADVYQERDRIVCAWKAVNDLATLFDMATEWGFCEAMRSRASGPTISHDEVCSRVAARTGVDPRDGDA